MKVKEAIMSAHLDEFDDFVLSNDNKLFQDEMHYERTLQDVVGLMLTHGYGKVLLEINRRFDYYEQRQA